MMQFHTTFVCDFETTLNLEQTKVWSAAFCEVGNLDPSQVTVVTSMDKWYQFLKQTHGNVVLYFHNLKFDGSFVLDYLFRRGYEFLDIPSNKLFGKQFTCSISDLGQWYTINFRIGQKMIEIRDSLKLLPFSVKAIGKAFKTKFQKLEMDYAGHNDEDEEITDEELAYIKNDVLVMSEALDIMFKEGHTDLTIGACCISEFKRTMLLKDDYDTFFPDIGKIQLDKRMYGSENADEYVRNTYKGGWCYLDPEKAEKVFYEGWSADINSSYTSNMSSQSGNRYPVGNPMFGKGDLPEEYKGDHYYYFIRFKCRFHLKPGHVPTIQIKHNCYYPSNDWLKTSDVWIEDGWYGGIIEDGEYIEFRPTMTMTKTDYELMMEHYDVTELEVFDWCVFHTEIGLFDAYNEKYKQMKQTSKGAKRTLAKLFLNNLYGKMASSDDSSHAIPWYDEKERIVKFKFQVENDKKRGYIPIGSAITSYARRFVIRAAQANYENFIYCDTDSIHCTGKPEEAKGITIHPTDFCCWKMEAIWDYAKFVRQKTYIEHITHEDLQPVDPYYKIRCAGMSADAKDEFLREHDITDFKPGLRLQSGLKPKRVPGGVVLVNLGFEMRDRVPFHIGAGFFD